MNELKKKKKKLNNLITHTNLPLIQEYIIQELFAVLLKERLRMHYTTNT